MGDKWGTFWSLSAGVPGIIKDFVWNYLPKDSYQDRAMPLVVGFKQLATLLSGHSEDLEERKKEFEKYKEGALRANIEQLVNVAGELFQEGATRDVFMEFAHMIEQPEVLMQLYVHGKGLSEVF